MMPLLFFMMLAIIVIIIFYIEWQSNVTDAFIKVLMTAFASAPHRNKILSKKTHLFYSLSGRLVQYDMQVKNELSLIWVRLNNKSNFRHTIFRVANISWGFSWKHDKTNSSYKQFSRQGVDQSHWIHKLV